MRSDDELLQQHAVHSARLVSAFTHGRRRSWAERRSLTSAVLVGGLLAVAVAFGSGVTVVVREQLAENQAQQEALERQQQENDRARQQLEQENTARSATTSPPP
jgi:uncharacterized protein HemX